MVMRLFSNPIVSMIGWAATVLSLFLGIYFYIQSIKKRDLVYFVNPAQAVVVKTGEASNLHVSYGDRELKSDVTAAQVAIWNRGNESVRPENILEPVTIHTSPSVQILEARIRKKSRDVVDDSLDQTRLSEGIVGVKWKIFEQGDGVVIQLVYAGSPSTQIKVSGVIEGQSEIRELKEPGSEKNKEGIKKPDVEMRNEIGFFIIAFGLFATITFICFIWVIPKRPSLRLPLIIRVIALTGLASAIVLIAIGVLLRFFFTSPNPPFGF